MKTYSTSPREIVASFWRNRTLILALVKREVIGRYRGSVLGIFWSLFHPIFMLGVYTFVFSTVFKARWNGTGDSKQEFALVLFAGLLVFNLFAECISRAPSLILSNANYVKKVVFPLEVFPWVSMGSALFHTLISFGVWLLFYMVFIGVPHPTIVFLPLIIAPLIMFTMGASWFLASIGVYLRDVSQLVSLLISVLMFLSPIFYPISALPPPFQSLIKLNPLAPAIDNVRNVLIWGRVPNSLSFSLYLIASGLIGWLGFYTFQKMRKGFADVL